MRKHLLSAIALAVCTVVGSAAGNAGAINGSLWLNQSGAASNATLGNISVASLGAPDSTFTPGAINYDSNVGGYTVGGFLNNPTFSNPGVAGQALNNTAILLTGTIGLNAGANSFVVGHDDGLQLNIDGIGLVVNTPGPTAFTNTPFNVNAPAAGNYTFELAYGECCGPPAELLFAINDIPVTGVPEPASLALLGTALAGFGIMRRRRKS